MKKWFLFGGEGGKKHEMPVRGRSLVRVCALLLGLGVITFLAQGNVESAQAATLPSETPTAMVSPNSTGSTVTVWIQVTDSCKQALSGATFTVSGPGVSTTTAATTGSTPKTVPNPTSGCPTQQGSCVNFSTGCTTSVLDVPSSGTSTYTITVAQTAPGQGTNASYMICQGGSDCPHGPEVATVTVSSSGSVTATTHNFYPDGVSVVWPTNRASFSGAQSDPILFHEFGRAAASTSTTQCDGDFDADDYLTGSPGSHCDSDKGSTGS